MIVSGISYIPSSTSERDHRRCNGIHQPGRSENIMAATAIARVTGRVLNVSNRSGTARATGNAYNMTILTILVADRGVTELILPREWKHEYPRDGDDLDLVVEFAGRPNGALGSSVLDLWPVSLHSVV